MHERPCMQPYMRLTCIHSMTYVGSSLLGPPFARASSLYALPWPMPSARRLSDKRRHAGNSTLCKQRWLHANQMVAGNNVLDFVARNWREFRQGTRSSVPALFNQYSKHDNSSQYIFNNVDDVAAPAFHMPRCETERLNAAAGYAAGAARRPCLARSASHQPILAFALGKAPSCFSWEHSWSNGAAWGPAADERALRGVVGALVRADRRAARPTLPCSCPLESATPATPQLWRVERRCARRVRRALAAAPCADCF
eukprot:361100-Chlamydomonas_euryale.AAC.5